MGLCVSVMVAVVVLVVAAALASCAVLLFGIVIAHVTEFMWYIVLILS